MIGGKGKEVRKSYILTDCMSDVSLTRISSKGQVVIPKAIREVLGITTGEVFAVFGEDDTIVLKRVSIPTEDEFEELLRWGTEYAKRRGITRDDVQKAIDEVREESE